MNLINVKNLRKTYEINKLFQPKRQLHALNDVSFELNEKETLGIVGESGCGKSTLAKVLTQLEAKTSGEIEFESQSIEKISLKNEYEIVIVKHHGNETIVFDSRKEALAFQAKLIEIREGMGRSR